MAPRFIRCLCFITVGGARSSSSSVVKFFAAVLEDESRGLSEGIMPAIVSKQVGRLGGAEYEVVAVATRD